MYRDNNVAYVRMQERIRALEEEAKIYRNNPELSRNLKRECYMFRKKAGDNANELERILRTMNRDKQKNRNK